MKKAINQSKLYSILIGIIPVLQIVLDTINTANLDENLRTIIGASLMLVLIILQGIERYLSPFKKNTALWISIIALIGFIAGGILDNLHIIKLAPNLESLVRLIFTLMVIVSAGISRQFGYDEDNFKNEITDDK